ncbi:MAG TPA: methyltransferase domain-containing protein, partial [Opitutales bacterium]|nr:methyltransferase domain-containing protein [Opitutales bacterium]
MSDISQHNQEIHENRLAWERKPALRRIYHSFYEEIAAVLPRGSKGLTVELGSGMGNIKEALPECITTDIFPNPWLDRVENAYALSFANQSVSNLILFDVWHHLQYPGAALREFRRVLAPGGVVVLFEPAMGLLGRAAYGLFHHEPLGLGKTIAWEIPENFDPAAQTYYAAQGNCWRLARQIMTKAATERPAALADWEITRVKYFPALAYLMSGGFRGPQLFPTGALPAIQAVEKLLAPLPALTAVRMLVVLR